MKLKELISSKWSKLSMKVRYSIFLFAGVLLGLLVQTSCTSIKNLMTKYPQDNIVEEIVEDAIENETGIDVDLSPSSKEK